MSLTGFRCFLQDFWIKSWLFRKIKRRSAEQTWSEQVHVGEEQSRSAQIGPKGKWIGIEPHQWRDPTLKEVPDNSSFQETAAKHQDKENPSGQGSGPVTERFLFGLAYLAPDLPRPHHMLEDDVRRSFSIAQLRMACSDSIMA